MIAFYSHHFPMALPAGHRFPVEKYELLYEAVRKHTASGLRLREAPEVSIDALARAHSNAYVEQMKTGSLPAHAQKALGLPWSKALYVRSLRSVGATLSASQAALKDGIAASLAGGTHHA
ncbi:MAG: histone deacetylase, partial [Pseudomonadota bacterium]